jgi:hypothetical protein
MRQLLSLFLLLFMPLVALADGMVIPTVAFPAKITIPDQRALICFSNGTERLVIETRFTGSGTNFAWVVPLPGQPVIEEATTGLFPTLEYLFRPEIVHEVPHYYSGILALIGIGYLLLFVRPSGRLIWPDMAACICVGVAAATSSQHDIFNAGAFSIVTLILFCDVLLIRIVQRRTFAVLGLTLLGFGLLAALLLPTLGAASRETASPTAGGTVSILDRKLVGIFETTTIASHDAKALQTWLLENGYVVPTNSEPVIESYVKDGWVFVAAKIRRDDAAPNTSTPHPLSFTFKTDKPVYPMRLTGLGNQPLSIELYVFSASRAAAPPFKEESCTQPNIVHPLLHQWTAGFPIATKLKATLSPSDMRHDVWLEQAPFLFAHQSRLFSWQGALTTALNWGTGFFAIGLAAVCFLTFASEKPKRPLVRSVGAVIVASVVLAGVVDLSLPKIEVRLEKGFFRIQLKQEQIALSMVLDDGGWRNVAEARSALQNATSNPTNAVVYGFNDWDNHLVGGQIREEDSPGNYLLRETNNQLQFVTFGNDGGEFVARNWGLPARHQTP